MNKFYDEIDERINNPEWSKQVAHKILLEKRHRDIKRRSVIGSFVGMAIILFTVGLYVITSISTRVSWEYRLISVIYGEETTTVFSEEIDEFIDEAF
jgi:hypothetical protein